MRLEIQLRRISTPAGDVAEFSSFRDGMNKLADAIRALSKQLMVLDEKVVKDLNALDDDLGAVKKDVLEVRGEVDELKEGISKGLEEIREGLDEVRSKVSGLADQGLPRLGELVEQKASSILENLREQGTDISELMRLVKFMALRIEYLEARLGKLEKDFRLLSLIREAAR